MEMQRDTLVRQPCIDFVLNIGRGKHRMAEVTRHATSATAPDRERFRSAQRGGGKPAGAGGTEVTYRLTVDVKIPMLGMIERKAEKVIIDRALAGLKKRVESE